MTDLEQVAPEKREAYLRDGALNAMWKAYSANAAIAALEEAERDGASLPPEKLVARNQFLGLSKKFLEIQRDKEMLRAVEELEEWAFVTGRRQPPRLAPDIVQALNSGDGSYRP